MASIVPNNTDNWVRVLLGLENDVKDALLDVLHNFHNDPSYNGLSIGEQQLYAEMLVFKQSHQKRLKNILSSDQWDTLCPQTGRSNSRDWDITLIIVVIINLLNLPSPSCGWKSYPSLAVSLSDFITLARKLRNDILHGSLANFTNVNHFNTLWTRMRWILQGLQYDAMKMAEFDKLKTNNLEFYTKATVNVLKSRYQQLKQDLHQCIQDQTKHEQAAKKEFQSIRQDVQDIEIDLQNNIHDINEMIDATKQAVKELRDRVDRVDSLYQDIEKLDSDLLNLHVSLTEQEQKMDILKKRVENLERNQIESNKDSVLTEVLEIICKHLNRPGLVKFCDYLGIHEHFLKTHCEWCCCSSCYPKLDEILMHNEVTWDRTNEALLQTVQDEGIIRRIVDEIQATLITTKMKKAAFDTKKRVGKKYSSKKFVDPLFSQRGERNFNETYVDLHLVKKHHHPLQSNFPSASRELSSFLDERKRISMNDIFTYKDECVIVSGIPGIGKSTLVDKIMMSWSTVGLFTGIDLIFHVKCRENINVIEMETTVENTFKAMFPEFKNVSLNVLKEVKRKLLIVDGIDELEEITSINENDKRNEKLSFFCKLIQQNNIFGFDKFILVSRPTVAKSLHQYIKSTTDFNTKQIEVCGFTKETAELFIQRALHAYQEAMQVVMFELRCTATLLGIYNVPAYLSIVCGLYREDRAIDTPTSTAELLLHALLFFFIHHFQKDNQREQITNELIAAVHMISKISFEMLSQNKGSIRIDNPEEYEEYFEKIGFIIGSPTKRSKAKLYTFSHQIVQELFSALYILQLTTEQKREHLNNHTLQNCWSLVVGLEKITQLENTSDVLFLFLNKLIGPVQMDLLRNAKATTIQEIQTQFRQFISSQEYIFLDDLRINESKYLEFVFAMHKDIDVELFDLLLGKLIVDFSRVIDPVRHLITKFLTISLAKSSSTIHRYMWNLSDTYIEDDLHFSILQRSVNVSIDTFEDISTKEDGINRNFDQLQLSTPAVNDHFTICDPSWCFDPAISVTFDRLPYSLILYLPSVRVLTLFSLRFDPLQQIVQSLTQNEIMKTQVLEINGSLHIPDELFFNIDHFQTIELNQCWFTNSNALGLTRSVLSSENLRLKHIVIRYCHLTNEAFMLLIAAFPHIQTVWIENFEPLSQTVFKDIAKFISLLSDDNLRKFYIRNSFYGIDMAIELSTKQHDQKFSAVVKQMDKKCRLTSSSIQDIMETFGFCLNLEFVDIF